MTVLKISYYRLYFTQCSEQLPSKYQRIQCKTHLVEVPLTTNRELPHDCFQEKFPGILPLEVYKLIYTLESARTFRLNRLKNQKDTHAKKVDQHQRRYPMRNPLQISQICMMVKEIQLYLKKFSMTLIEKKVII